jgi:hypothetical protein
MPRYALYGLLLDSEMECPKLVPAEAPDAEPDDRIRLGPMPQALDDAKKKGVLYQISPDRFLLGLGKIARYLVSEGREIVIERVPGGSDDAVRVFLFGSVFGALLHQRGVLPLHGSAVMPSRGATIFAGPSNSGKSALAAAFHRRGYDVLADDVCAITFDAGKTPGSGPPAPSSTSGPIPSSGSGSIRPVSRGSGPSWKNSSRTWRGSLPTRRPSMPFTPWESTVSALYASSRSKDSTRSGS